MESTGELRPIAWNEWCGNRDPEIWNGTEPNHASVEKQDRRKSAEQICK